MYSHSITLICKQCNKPFSTDRKDAQFCNLDCRRAYNTACGKVKIPHTCQHCGKEFMAYAHAERSFCSRQCYWQAKPKPSNTTCEVCDKPFRNSPSWPGRFCSIPCRNIGLQKREERHCKQCGSSFITHPSDKKMYCSLSCGAQVANHLRQVPHSTAICAKCGKEFEYKNRNAKRKYCSRACSDSVKKNPPTKEWIAKQCAYCGQAFMCEPWHPETQHCSVKCAGRHKAQTVQGSNHPLWKGRIEMACEVCGKMCSVKPCITKRFRACSRRCATILSVQSQQGRTSSIEIKMREAMECIALYPVHQHVIGYYIVDFAFLEHHLVVECDGDYWHNIPKQKVKDRQKDAYLHRHGWTIIRLTETDIKASADECATRVQIELQHINSLL